MSLVRIKTSAARLLIVLTALCLGACGIDQGGSQNPPPTTSQATLVSGPISGFGSVSVNGLTLDTSAAQILVDGVPASEADLREGQFIRAITLADSSSTQATLIEYQENLVGSIDAVDVPNATLIVLGQTVSTNSETRFDVPQVNALGDLQPNERIVVSGIPTPNGDVLATYIGSAEPTEPFEITASITDVDLAALTFALGNLTVDYSQANLLDLLGGMPELDLVVEVSGTVTVGNVLVADQVRALPRVPGLFNEAATGLTDFESPLLAGPATSSELAANFIGFITANNLPGSIVVADIEVLVDVGTIIVGGTSNELQPGSRIQVEGLILNSGQIQADRIIIL